MRRSWHRCARFCLTQRPHGRLPSQLRKIAKNSQQHQYTLTWTRTSSWNPKRFHAHACNQATYPQTNEQNTIKGAESAKVAWTREKLHGQGNERKRFAAHRSFWPWHMVQATCSTLRDFLARPPLAAESSGSRSAVESAAFNVRFRQPPMPRGCTCCVAPLVVAAGAEAAKAAGIGETASRSGEEGADDEDEGETGAAESSTTKVFWLSVSLADRPAIGS